MSDQDLRFSAALAKIDALERKIAFILRSLNLEYHAEDSATATTDALGEVYALLLQGRKLQAIQAYQIATGASLQQARDAVLQIASRIQE